MNWNLVLDDLAPALPLLRYQYLSRQRPVSFPTRAANLYLFAGIAVGGIGLNLSLNSHAPMASLANVFYWGVFTMGLSAFSYPTTENGETSPPVEQNENGSPQNLVTAQTNPIINIRYQTE
jgi:hypothetical protein